MQARLHTFLVALAIGIGIAPLSAAGQVPKAATQAPLQLTVDAAISMARERAPDVRMAGHRVREAEATRVGAGLITPANPRLSMEVRQSWIRPQYPSRELGYSATIDSVFELGGAPSARVREAGARTQAAAADAAVVRLHAGLDAWRAYLAAAVAEQRIDDLRSALSLADRVLAASRERISAGAAGDIDEMTARLEVAQINVAIEAARRERDAYVMVVRELVDLPAGAQIEIVTRPEPPPPAPALESILHHAMATRPELAAIRSRIQLLDSTNVRLEREVFPRVGVYAGVDSAPYSAPFWGVGASIELPFIQRNQGPLAVNARERESERTRLDLEVRRIQREVAATWAAFEARRVELQMVMSDALPAAERNLDLITTGWRSGRFDIFRVTTAARDVVRVKAMRLDALEAAWVERIALERAAGGWPS